MKLEAGSVTISIAGTAEKLTSDSSKTSLDTAMVKSIEVYARKNNTAAVYFGPSDVSSTTGREIEPGGSVNIDFDDGSIPMDTFFVDASVSGDKLDWLVVLAGQ